MKFDEMLKNRAKSEGSPLPKGFEHRLNALLADLPDKTKAPRRRFRLSRATAVAVAAVFVVGAGAATAAPAVLTMTQGVIDYFREKSDSEYVARQDEFEKYNASVGMSRTSNGKTITINNLAVDDSYMNVFYTLKSDTPIEKIGDENVPESWRAAWTAPVFYADVNGKQLDTFGSVENEAYFVDDYTLAGINRLVLREKLPDNFELMLYTGELISGSEDAEFRFPLSIDKSAVSVDSHIVEPMQEVHFHFDEVIIGDGSGPEDIIPAWDTDITIDRISVSPLCSSITITDYLGCSPFVLRDDKGKCLPFFNYNGSTSGDLSKKVTNVLEFFGTTMDTKSVTLIPIGSSTYRHTVVGSIDALPLTDDTPNGFVLESLNIGEKQAEAHFSFKGDISMPQTEFYLLDENGNDVPFEACTDQKIDRETGEFTVYLYYPQATPEQVKTVKKVSFWQNDDITLYEDQAVTINLQ